MGYYDYYGLLFAIMACYELLRAKIVFYGPLWIIMGYYELLSAAVISYSLLWAVTVCYELLWGYCRLLRSIVGYCDSRPQ